MKVKELIKKNVIKLCERIKKIKKRSKYCILVGLVLSIVSFITNQDSIYIRPYEIERGSYGEQKTPYNLKVDVENLSKNMEFNVSVSSKKYTREEADKKFDEKFETLLVNILNDNVDYEHINKKLNFQSDLGDGIKSSYAFEPRIREVYDSDVVATSSEIAINSEIATGSDIKAHSEIATSSDISFEQFNYYVKYQNVIDGSGNVHNENFKVNDFCTGHIIVQFSTDIKEKEGSYRSKKYMIPVKVINRELSPLEAFKNAFKKEVDKNDKESIEKNTIILPKIVNDFKIIYKEKKDLTFILMPIIGVLVAILLDAKDKEKEKEKIKRRIRLLELDFSQIISKILLYVSSGMTIRNSMIRLAEQYQKMMAKDEKQEKRVAYEELVIVKNKLASGYSEIGAYEDMAKNINMRSYTRFLNIIIQSIKNGNKELKNILNMEVQDALYERKQNAKKLGEEAATKLVLPLMLMLSVIMVVIMVPAFMGM
ncbi:MAG: type II secretion system F family protein [Lachnospiraceae bacterium]|nr:type II secretion system F family protein [Lachnospiraceae bacterium]